jgi:MFS family permease
MNVAHSHHEEQENSKGILENLFLGFRLAKHPWILMAFASGFIVKGESYLMSNTLFLWTRSYYTQAQHKEATLRASTLALYQYGAGLVFSIAVTNFVDKLSKTAMLSLFFGSLITGLLAMVYMNDPMNDMMKPTIMLLGSAIGGLYLMTHFLLAKYSPAMHRGKAYGALAVLGFSSLLICSFVGGYLFDIWTRHAQFLIFTSFSSIALLILAYIHCRYRNPDSYDEVSDDM